MRLFFAFFMSVAVFALSVPLFVRAGAEPVKIEPQSMRLKCDAVKYKPYTLVRIKADNVDPKAGIIWRVYPKDNVQRATTPRGVLEFVAPPGIYQVECLVIKNGEGGAIDVEEQSVTIEIESCCDKVPPLPMPPTPDPKKPEPKKPDPANALGQIQFGPFGCTATVIAPRRSDGKWDVLTAAHCVEHVGPGGKGKMKLKDGRTLGVTVVSVHDKPDCAWLTTDDAGLADLSFATIAEKNPERGAKIWHAGYGIDKPGNREDGEITVGQDSNGQLEMSLSVSSGDSGGGIFRNDTGELISCVCCTTSKGNKARVWGCAAEVARKYRPGAAADTGDWQPREMPTRNVMHPIDWSPFPFGPRD